MIHIVCVRTGEAYGPEYVEILADMVARNATQAGDLAFWCVTDRPDQLPAHVNPIAHDPQLPGWWQKLRLFSPEMPWGNGERIAYFDLDVAITGRLEDLLQRKGIIRDWHWPCFNSSVMVWDHGEHRIAWEHFAVDPAHFMTRPASPELAPLLPAGQVNGGDQEFLTEADRFGGDSWETFPAEWCVSARSCPSWPTARAKVVVFHGRPKPHEVAAEGWVGEVWKVGGLTSLPEMGGVNVDRSQILANVDAACTLDLPWFTGFGERKQRLVLVCGGPSMRRHVADIRHHQRQGARVISVNAAGRYLARSGVTPDGHVMLDARPDNAEFLDGLPVKVPLFLASQVHPDVYLAASVQGRPVTVWHAGWGDCEELWARLAPWRDLKPIVIVPGGGTVGLRALWLAAFSGYRTVHVYGLDSSYDETGEHHAYRQLLNEGEDVLSVRVGPKAFRCARWMARQADEFRDTWRELRREGVTVHVHGQGLIPEIARILREEAREAAA